MFHLKDYFSSPPVYVYVYGCGSFNNYCAYMVLLCALVSHDYILVFSAIYWSFCNIASSIFFHNIIQDQLL